MLDWLPSLIIRFFSSAFSIISCTTVEGGLLMFHGLTRPPCSLCCTVQVHKDLPGILKEYTKAVIRENLTNEKDIIAFSLDYFKQKCETNTPSNQ